MYYRRGFSRFSMVGVGRTGKWLYSVLAGRKRKFKFKFPFPTGLRLRRVVRSRIDMKLSRGGWLDLRRSKGYPVNGQRTHSNGQTARKRLWARVWW
jgi:hypothetical protein